MSLIKNVKNPKVQQYILELIFPIIGYLFFDWSLLIIILFYLLDIFGAEVAFWFRLNFVQKIFLPVNKFLLPIAILAFILLFFLQAYLLDHTFRLYIFDCNIYFYHKELIDFLKSEFLLLFPLLILLHYVKDKFEFYKTQLPQQFTPNYLVFSQIIIHVLVFLFIVALGFIWAMFKFHEIWIFIIIPLSKLVLDFLILPRIKAKLVIKTKTRRQKSWE